MVSPRRASPFRRMLFQRARGHDGHMNCFTSSLKIAVFFAFSVCFCSFYRGSQHISYSSLLLLQSFHSLAEGGENLRRRSSTLIQQTASEIPSIVWLLSLPDSGEAIVLSHLQKLTPSASTTAPPSGRSDQPDVPVPIEVELPRGRLIVTKNHCGADIDRVFDLDNSTHRFDERCRKTSRDKYQKSSVDSLNPKKAIVLFRSPFQFLLSRMSSDVLHSNNEMRKENSVETLVAWCKRRDAVSKTSAEQILLPAQNVESKLDGIGRVLCPTELARWIHWHNQAIATIERLDLPVLFQFYEDYTTRLHETLNELKIFLKLPIVDKNPLSIEPSSIDLHLLAEEDARATATFVRSMATPQSWYHLRRYFKGRYSPTEKDNQAELYGRTLDNPGIALLISFPNSGTSYTLINIQNVTRWSVASNTGRETRDRIPVRTDIDNGPFLFEPQEGKHHRFALTKTHCSGFCDNCDQKSSSPSLIAFEQACRTSTRIVQGTTIASVYNVSVISRVVHLFRDPFSNIVARMHLGVGKRAREGWKAEDLARFKNSPEGLLAWCDHVDAAFGNDPSYFPLSARGTFASVPCYSEIYRYVKWHNRALQTIDLYGVPAHTLYYEDYESKYDETLHNLLAFLEMDRTHDNSPFVAGKRYSTLFETGHRLAIARLAYQLASPDCWVLLKRYFDGFQPDEIS